MLQRANKLWDSNNKLLTFSEIYLFLQIFEEKRPHLKVLTENLIQFKGTKNNQIQTNCDVSINFDVFDQKTNTTRSIIVYFLEHCKDANSFQQMIDLCKASKTLLRRDIVLQVYDATYLSIEDELNIFFIIECEQIHMNLNQYCQLHPHLTIQHQILTEHLQKYLKNKIQFKSIDDWKWSILSHFFVQKLSSNEVKIKFLPLNSQLFYYTPYKELNQGEKVIEKQTIQLKEQKEIDEIKIEGKVIVKLVEECEYKIQRNKLTTFIVDKFTDILQVHNIKLFEFISQMQNFDDFELDEYDDDYLIIKGNSQNHSYFIKAEKFTDREEALNVFTQNQIFFYQMKEYFSKPRDIHFIDIDPSYYILYLEEIFAYHSNERLMLNQNNKILKDNEEAILPLSNLCEQGQYNKMNYKEELKIIKIVLQLLNIADTFCREQIQNGSFTLENIYYKCPKILNLDSIQLYLPNPLLLSNKMKNVTIRQRDEQSFKQIIQTLLSQVYLNINFKAALKFQKQSLLYITHLYKHNAEDFNIVLFQSQYNKINSLLMVLNRLYYIHIINLPFLSLDSKQQIKLNFSRQSTPNIYTNQPLNQFSLFVEKLIMRVDGFPLKQLATSEVNILSNSSLKHLSILFNGLLLKEQKQFIENCLIHQKYIHALELSITQDNFQVLSIEPIKQMNQLKRIKIKFDCNTLYNPEQDIHFVTMMKEFQSIFIEKRDFESIKLSHDNYISTTFYDRSASKYFKDESNKHDAIDEQDEISIIEEDQYKNALFYLRKLFQQNRMMKYKLSQVEKNKNILSIQIINIYNTEYGKLIANFDIDQEYMVVSYSCRSKEKMECQYYHKQLPKLDQLMLDNWLISEYRTQLALKILGEPVILGCSHKDFNEIQFRNFKYQSCLKKLYTSINLCVNVAKKGIYPLLEDFHYQNIASMQLTINQFDINNNCILKEFVNWLKLNPSFEENKNLTFQEEVQLN